MKGLVFCVAFSPDAPLGEIFDLVTLNFDDSELPQLNVQVRAHKGGRFAVIPKVVKVPPFIGDETHSRRVRVMSVPHGQFQIHQVDTVEGVTVDKIPEEPRNVFDLTLHFTRQAQTQPQRTILIRTEPEGTAALAVEYESKSGT